MPEVPLPGVTARPEILAFEGISELLTHSGFDIIQLLDRIVRTTAEQMGVKASAIRVVDAETGTLRLRAVHGLSQKFLAQGQVFDTWRRFRQLSGNGGVLEVHDINLLPDPPFVEAAEEEGIRSLLAVGLYLDGEILGALSIYTGDIHDFDESEILTLRAIANQASVAIRLARLYRAQVDREWLERELGLAAEIQASVLPRRMPELPGMQVAATSTPWHQVGGDFYDFIGLPEDNLGITIGDISGKGLPAALLMFTVRMALRAHAEHEYGVKEIMRRVNHALYRDTRLDTFATLFYGVLNIPSRVFTYVNASQDPPLVFRGSEVVSLETGGLPVGMLPGERYEQDMVQLHPGDVFVLYTDGIIEASNAEGEIYGTERLVESVQRHRHLDPEGIIRVVEEAVMAYSEGTDQGDDRTLVVLKVD